MNKDKTKLFTFVLYFSIFFIPITFFTYNILAQDITITVTGQSNDESSETVVVFDQQDLEQSQKKSLVEFLQTQSFLYIARGIDDSEIGFLVLRGFTTSRIAIFLDGVPITLAQINAMKLPLAIISKIVIYKGNVSALFGPNAVGGAILIWTKGKEDGAINFGSFNLSSLMNFDCFLHLSSFNNKLFSSFDIQVNLNNNLYDNSFGKSNFYDIFSKVYFSYLNFSISILADFYKKYLPNDIQFPYYNTYKDNFSILSVIKINNFLFSFQFINEKFKCHDYTYNIDEEKKLFSGFFNIPFLLFKKDTISLTSNIGLKLEYFYDNTLTYENILNSILTSSFSLNKNFTNSFSFVATVSIDLNLKYTQSIDYLFMPSFYFEFNKTLEYNQSNSLNLFLKLASGYRLPSYQELYSSYGIMAVGNPELKPEKSLGAEAGLSFNIENFQANLSFYYYYFNDFIVWIRRFDNRFKPLNFASGYNLGLDANIEYLIPVNSENYFQLTAMLSITIPKILEGILVLNEVYVPYIPLLNFIFNVDFVKIEKFLLRLEFIYRGIRYITLENYNWFSPYFLMNLNFTYFVSDKRSVLISLNNILGATYYDLLYYPIKNITLNIELSFYF